MVRDAIDGQLQWYGSLWLVIVSIVVGQSAQAETIPSIKATPDFLARTEIPSLAELDRPATTVEEWLAQSLMQIVGVQLNPTPDGIEVILEIAQNRQLTPSTSTIENTLIVDIPNVVLALPDGDEFEVINPAAGIVLVTVTSSENGIQVAITGIEAPPVANVRMESQQLVLNVSPSAETDVVTTSEDAIQVVVTATRTEEELLNVPRSVTAIEREQIEEQTNIARDVRDIISRFVPGFSPPTQIRNANASNLRGREPAFLINGVPLNTNSDQPRILRSISPDAIERIEVVRGPSAIYGAQATGGVVNIIIRRPTEERLESTIELGVNAAAGGGETFLVGESFGNYLQYGFSGREGDVDFLFSLSRNDTGMFFDAEGDRIANDRPIDQTVDLNILGTIGVNFSDEQRLELTFNHYNSENSPDYIQDPSVDVPVGTRKSRALEVGELRFENGANSPFERSTLATLSYTHENIFGSQVQLQGYYRDFSQSLGLPFDARGTEFYQGTISSGASEAETWGGRLQINTPVFSGANLLWGADYNHERDIETFVIYDPATFDESGGRVFREIARVEYAGPYSINSVGLFAQLQWDISDRFLLSGGVRHERVVYSVDDYTTFIFDARDIEGGEFNLNDTVFNLGGIYRLSNDLSVFASFAQGFSVPKLYRALGDPSADRIEDAVEISEPVVVNNYEIGVRGNWSNVQASVAVFYNTSELGETFVFAGRGSGTRIIRAPQRIYGMEAAVDWQPIERWQLGGTLTWQEGENNPEDNEQGFLPLSSSTISPLKLTAYIEHQTTPGWRNRLQAIYVGNRDHAFDEGVDLIAVDDYIVVDFISSVEIGPGDLNIGVENLFNTQYFTINSQVDGAFSNTFRYPARGRTLSVNYRVTF